MNLTPGFGVRTGPAGSKPPARPHHKIVALHGELDIATTPDVRERLNDALSSTTGRGRRLVIDLSGVTFCDASGLAVLIGTQRRARLLGTAVSLVAPRAQVVKLLHITGLDRNLTIHPTLTSAIQDHPATAAKTTQGPRPVASALNGTPSAR
jgi:anti-anti-sigma factor